MRYIKSSKPITEVKTTKRFSHIFVLGWRFEPRELQNAHAAIYQLNHITNLDQVKSSICSKPPSKNIWNHHFSSYFKIYLKFRRPQQKQFVNFRREFVDLGIPDWRIPRNMPKSKSFESGVSIGHKLLRNVIFVNEWCSWQQKVLMSHPFTIWQACCQQTNILWIAKQYHTAPSTWMSKKLNN